MSLQLPIPSRDEIDQNYDAWFQVAFLVANNILHDVPSAEDIALECIKRLWETCNQQAIDLPRAWVRKTAKNLAINEKNKRHRSNLRWDGPTDDGEGPSLDPGREDEHPSYLDEVRLHDCIRSKLTPAQREVFEQMIQLQGADFREIAKRTGRSEKNVQDLTAQIRRRAADCRGVVYPD